MITNILVHGALGLAIFYLIWISGKYLSQFFPKDLQTFFIYPCGIIFISLIAWLSLINMLFLLVWIIFLLYQKNLWPKNDSFNISNLISLLLYLTYSTVFAFAFGNYFCGPLQKWETGVYGDTISYVSWMNSFVFDPINRPDLTVLGAKIGFHNMAPVLFGAPLLKYELINPSLFYVISIPLVGIFSIGQTLRSKESIYKNQLLQIFVIIVFVLAIPYIGFTVESPPVLLAFPLMYSIYGLLKYTHKEPQKNIIFLIIIILGSCYLTKFSLSAFLAHPLFNIVKKFNFLKTIVAVGCTLLSCFIYFKAHEWAIIENLKISVPELINFSHHDLSLSKILNYSFPLIILGLFLVYTQKHFLFDILLGWLLFSFLYNVFSSALAASSLLSIFCFKKKIPLKSLLICWSTLPLMILKIAEQDSNNPFHLKAILAIGLFILFIWKSKNTFLAFKSILSVFLLFVFCTAFFEQVFFSNPYPRNTIKKADIEVWQKVKELIPKDALIFTDSTGLDVDYIKGWNSLAGTGQRQIYIAGWYNSFLRKEMDELKMRLKKNSTIISEENSDIEKNQFQFTSYYFVTRNCHVLKKDRVIFQNSEYKIWAKP